jgi:hypothetical protein
MLLVSVFALGLSNQQFSERLRFLPSLRADIFLNKR